MEESGLGALQQAFEVMKKRLQAEGLFSSTHKQTLPEIPKCIGVISSPTGAAIRDIITTLRRRYPAIPVIIYPSLVQGDRAAAQLSRAINLANDRNECDVLILARGGGSLEDLWPFNEESVARAIFASTIPIVSAIGHEIDISIADLVADVRAPTPTAAAELVSPQWQTQFAEFEQMRSLLLKAMSYQLQTYNQQIDFISQRLRNPKQQLREAKLRLQQLWQSLTNKMQNQLSQATYQIQHLSGRLHSLSPLATLQRGYAIARYPKSDSIIRSITPLKPNQRLDLQFSDGTVEVTVDKVNADK